MFKKKLYSNNSSRPFKLSRTKIDLFFDCRLPKSYREFSDTRYLHAKILVCEDCCPEEYGYYHSI